MGREVPSGSEGARKSLEVMWEKRALQTLKYMLILESGGKRENQALRIKSFPLERIFVCLWYVSAHISHCTVYLFREVALSGMIAQSLR